ncbi:MAG: Unknown protein [uncultured Sulfurovum sp.]|uniref:Uncharacterized protein n=1 Tax=uncultured Sulfurovum sp. TaxID=269237 RepID=A0A6S6SN02_9BACT|nr:MAG: Unknown protein [uncultured Sulfurovum sp.]
MKEKTKKRQKRKMKKKSEYSPTPEDLVTYLKYIHSNIDDSRCSIIPKEYQAITLEKANGEFEKYTDHDMQRLKPLEDYLNDVFSKFLADGLRDLFNESVRVGILYSSDQSARVYSTKDNHYAIMYDYTLVMLMKTHLSFMLAYNRPQDVRFCNLGDTENMTQEFYRNEHNKFLKNVMYSRQKPIVYPLFKFEGIARSLLTIEMYTFDFFIIGHELTHIANGDLRPIETESEEIFFQEASYKVNTESHEREYFADLGACSIYFRLIKGLGFDIKKEDAMKSTIDYFVLLHFLGDSFSETHPHPLDRASFLIDSFLGENYNGFLRQEVDRFSPDKESKTNN